MKRENRNDARNFYHRTGVRIFWRCGLGLLCGILAGLSFVKTVKTPAVVFAQGPPGIYDTDCSSGLLRYSPHVSQNAQNQHFNANTCINPSTGVMTFQGNVNTPTLGGNTIFIVGSAAYPSCPAAVTGATGTNGAVVLIPGSGPVVDCNPTTPENITLWNFDKTRDWCNGDGGAATPPCFAMNYGYDDANVFAGLRLEMTTSHQDINGVTLGLYSITHLKNATANGTSGIDGFSAEADSEGTLTGTFSAFQAHEASATVKSTGGTITDVRGGVFFFNSPNATATAVTNATGVKALGCNSINAGSRPVNCYGIEMSDQTSGGVGKATTRNYSFISRGLGIFGYSGGLAAGGFDLEDASNVARPFLRVDSSSNVILEAINANGLLIEDSTGANQLKSSSSGIGIFVRIFSQVAGTANLGLGSNPFGSAFIGGAATNNAQITGTFTAARTHTLSDASGGLPVLQNCGTTSTCAKTAITGATVTVIGGPIALAAGTLTVTALPFSSSTSYVCSPDDSTGINGIDVVYNSGSSATFNGTGTDSIRYSCTGN